MMVSEISYILKQSKLSDSFSCFMSEMENYTDTYYKIYDKYHEKEKYDDLSKDEERQRDYEQNALKKQYYSILFPLYEGIDNPSEKELAGVLFFPFHEKENKQYGNEEILNLIFNSFSSHTYFCLRDLSGYSIDTIINMLVERDKSHYMDYFNNK